MSHHPTSLRAATDVRFGAGTQIGENVVIHAGVEIGRNVVIQDGAILGKRPSLAGREADSELLPLVIADEAVICAQAIVFASARIGANAIIGDQAYIRERATVGNRTVVGRGSTVDNDVIVGDRVLLQTQVYLTAFSEVEDDVFIGPCATTTNDDTMNRHEGTSPLRGATLRRACRIGGGAVITPGVTIGEEAFVAAGAVVTADVPERTLVMGVPARAVRSIRDDELLEHWRKAQ